MWMFWIMTPAKNLPSGLKTAGMIAGAWIFPMISVQVIEESWAREDLIPPYHIYVKMAYHLSQEARSACGISHPTRFRQQIIRVPKGRRQDRRAPPQQTRVACSSAMWWAWARRLMATASRASLRMTTGWKRSSSAPRIWSRCGKTIATSIACPRGSCPSAW